ncbi:glycosyltransferase, partial [bacterium AH-315-K20]|nr:glycosyltransferase [bacterium AH-315-K20]
MSIQPHPNCAHAVVALIATRGRDDLLLTRAIPAVLGQARSPERLVVVLDESKEERSDTDLVKFEKRVRILCGDLHVTILRNRRTPSRAAGAWNTGLDQLHRDAAPANESGRFFVAILDDDDMWEPDHLELCLKQAVAADLSMVGAGLIRHDTSSDAGHRHAIPERLDPRELFVRGQHIQGSNLFVRLDMLLKAGMFDEHLPSCTDRDLCIRLADLPDLRFGRIDRHTVHHYADPRPDRLSTPGSTHKLDGLTRFWHKHADRFDGEAREQFARRAHELFGWTPPNDQVSTETIPELSQPPRPVDLVVGFVTDAVVPEHVRGLLEDLCQLCADSG